MAMSTPFVSNKEKIRKRDVTPRQFELSMTTVGTLMCDVCKVNQEITFINWFFVKQTIRANLTIICRNTRCLKSRGKAFQNMYELELVDMKEDEKKARLSQHEQPQNNHYDFYVSVVSVKGIGEKTAGLLIENKITSPSHFNNLTVEQLEDVGLNISQITKLRKKFYDLANKT